jgi:hypothetical protein
VSKKKINTSRRMREAMCNNGIDWVWNDELMAICGQNSAIAQLKISWGVLLSNSSESRAICFFDNMGGNYNLIKTITESNVLSSRKGPDVGNQTEVGDFGLRDRNPI